MFQLVGRVLYPACTNWGVMSHVCLILVFVRHLGPVAQYRGRMRNTPLPPPRLPQTRWFVLKSVYK